MIPVTRPLPERKELFRGDDWAEEESCPEEVLKLDWDPSIGPLICFPTPWDALGFPVPVQAAEDKAGGADVVGLALDRELFAVLDRLIALSAVEDPWLPDEERRGGWVPPRHVESLLGMMVNHCSDEKLFEVELSMTIAIMRVPPGKSTGFQSTVPSFTGPSSRVLEPFIWNNATVKGGRPPFQENVNDSHSMGSGFRGGKNMPPELSAATTTKKEARTMPTEIESGNIFMITPQNELSNERKKLGTYYE